MQHFVITRFNIASPGREVPIRNTPGWLERRFDLFEAYCLPSIAAQEQGQFQWLIYFDQETPAEFRKRIDRARERVAFEPIFVGPFSMSEVAADVQARLATRLGRIVTTRLDNDDAIANDLLQRIRLQAEQLPDGTIINFRDGIALSQGRLYAATDTSNPFTSLVEQAEGAQTIWAAPHTELASRFAIRQVLDEPSWLQVVHGENVTNRIKGRRLADKDVMARFTLSPKVAIRSTGRIALAADRLALFPIRQARELAIKVAKRILRR